MCNANFAKFCSSLELNDIKQFKSYYNISSLTVQNNGLSSLINF